MMNSARRSGFSLLELVIVIALMAIMAIAVLPNLRKSTTSQPQEFVVKLNALMQSAWQQALLSGRVQKIIFNFSTKKIVLHECISAGKTSAEDKFVPVTGTYLETELDLPLGYTMNNFYVDGKDEMMRSGKRETVFFYVMPAGMAEPVIINMSFVDEDHSEQPVWKFGMVLNPFSAQFEYYDTFQRP